MLITCGNLLLHTTLPLTVRSSAVPEQGFASSYYTTNVIEYDESGWQHFTDGTFSNWTAPARRRMSGTYEWLYEV